MVDHDPPGGGKPISVFESGAMLVYLAEKTGKFLPKEPRARADVMQWLFWQMGGLGPMSGQNNHFSNYATDKIQYAMDRYRNEVNRLYGVMDRRLADRPFLAGEYSIADMASYPWVMLHERQHQKIADFPHLKKWLDAIAARPARCRRPMSMSRRSIRATAASAPRRSAPSCSARPRRRSTRRRPARAEQNSASRTRCSAIALLRRSGTVPDSESVMVPGAAQHEAVRRWRGTQLYIFRKRRGPGLAAP